MFWVVVSYIVPKSACCLWPMITHCMNVRFGSGGFCIAYSVIAVSIALSSDRVSYLLSAFAADYGLTFANAIDTTATRHLDVISSKVNY